jgi:hypothetical protein
MHFGTKNYLKSTPTTLPNTLLILILSKAYFFENRVILISETKRSCQCLCEEVMRVKITTTKCLCKSSLSPSQYLGFIHGDKVPTGLRILIW